MMNIGTLSDTFPEHILWSKYFSGILAEERDRDWAKALTLYTETLQQHPEPILRAHILLSLGVAYANQAQWDKSISLCEESSSLWQQIGDFSKQAMVLRQIALSIVAGFDAGEFETEDLIKAKSYCKSALAILYSGSTVSEQAVLYQPNVPLYQALVWDILGVIHRCLGEHRDAIDNQKRYLELARSLDNEYLIAAAYMNLGDCYHLLGHENQQHALDLYEQSIAIFNKSSETYDEFMVWAKKGRLHQKSGDFTLALVCFEQSLTMIEAIRAGITSEAARIGFFATIVNVYANTILACLHINDHNRAFNYVERIRSRAFLDRLRNITLTQLDQVKESTITLSELQKLSHPDAIYLEFFTTGLHAIRGRPISNQLVSNTVLFPPEKTLLFAVTNDHIQIHDVDLSPNHLIPSDPHKPVEEYFLDPHIRRTLYDKLIAPVAELFEGKRRVYIIPHGPLHYVPFQALIAPDGETLLRADGPEIVYAPSATILFRERHRPERAATGICLTVGYNGSGETELLFAEEEAHYISTMAKGNELIGSIPKKEALYRQAPNYQLLHFSCHGHFDPESPLESALHIAPDEVLTGHEIIDNLKLNCDLVTLSACDSGLSKVQRGDELYGLIRAFMYAGAPAIIASLWRVDERTTLLIAEKFYQALQAGAGYAAALKEAQVFLKNLTRKDAVDLLSRYLVREEGDLAVAQHKSTARLAPAIKQQAERYIIGLRTKGASNGYQIVPGTEDDEKIFSAPWFWAPFVLIGDPQARSG